MRDHSWKVSASHPLHSAEVFVSGVLGGVEVKRGGVATLSNKERP